MLFNQSTKQKLDVLIQSVIAVDIVILLLLFLSSQFGVSFPFPLPGTKLNNPLALLLILLFLRGRINDLFRERCLKVLEKLVTRTPHRFCFFTLMIVIEIVLQIMWFNYPLVFHWNLNAEQGYGTHFSVIQLYLLGLIVMMTAWADHGQEGVWKERVPWYLVAGVYFYISLDDCIGIHENFIFWTRDLVPDATVFHFIHEWLWFYAPLIVAVVIFLSRFFLMKFRYSWGILTTMFMALGLWVSVILLEGLAKNIVDPTGLDQGRLLIGIEEGAEMLGATLFMLGFSKHLKNVQEGRRKLHSQ